MSNASNEKQQKFTASEETSAKKVRRVLRAGHFRYYIHDGIAECRLQLLGELTETDIADLNGCWRTAKTTLGSRRLVLDLYALRSVDEAGKQWLAGIAQEGATCSPDNYLRDLVAGKHTAGVDASEPSPRPGLFGRILGFLRGAGVEAVK